LHEPVDAPALQAAQHRRHAVLGGLDDADDLTLDAHGVEIVAGGLFHVGVFLCPNQDVRSLAAQRLDQSQRARTSDLDRH